MVLDGLGKEQFVLIESFKRNGEGVKTPVWVVGRGDVLWAWTNDNSWKVRRIRHNGRARLAPCDSRGNVLGAWVDVSARVIDDVADELAMRKLLKQKYGWMFSLFAFVGRVRGQASGRVVLEFSAD